MNRKLNIIANYDPLTGTKNRNSYHEAIAEFIYQKTDGTFIQLRILKFKTYTALCRETLWIFSNADEI